MGECSKKGFIWVVLFFVVFWGSLLYQEKPVKAASGPGRPGVTVVKRKKTTATIKIQKHGKTTGYHIYLKTKNGRYNLVKIVLHSGSVKLTKLNAKKTYYVRVRAYLTAGFRIRRSGFSKAKRIGPYQKPKKESSSKTSSTNDNNAKATPAPQPASSLTPSDTSEISASMAPSEEPSAAPVGLAPSEEPSATPEGLAPSEEPSATPVGMAPAEEPSAVPEGHRASILNSSFGKLGAGYCSIDAGYRHYWVQLFSN